MKIKVTLLFIFLFFGLHQDIHTMEKSTQSKPTFGKLVSPKVWGAVIALKKAMADVNPTSRRFVLQKYLDDSSILPAIRANVALEFLADPNYLGMYYKGNLHYLTAYLRENRSLLIKAYHISKDQKYDSSLTDFIKKVFEEELEKRVKLNPKLFKQFSDKILGPQESFRVNYVGATPGEQLAATVRSYHQAGELDTLVEIIRLMFIGADVNDRNNHLISPTRMTSLHWAIIRKNPSLVELLLENGADMYKSSLGVDPSHVITPYQEAVKKGDIEILRILNEYKDK